MVDEVALADIRYSIRHANSESLFRSISYLVIVLGEQVGAQQMAQSGKLERQRLRRCRNNTGAQGRQQQYSFERGFSFNDDGDAHPHADGVAAAADSDEVHHDEVAHSDASDDGVDHSSHAPSCHALGNSSNSSGMSVS